MLLYRLLRRLLAFASAVFFRQVAVSGTDNIPDGAVIFAGNHPNSLLDPVLLLVTCGRVCRFAAKDVLFRGRIMRWLLDGLGAVPVARRMDHGPAGADALPGTVDNQASFDRLSSVLAAGGAMGIFPEGISHDAAHLSRLKTGAARIALTVAARGIPVRVVPCGLTYVRRKSFRGRVLVQYGVPIEVPVVSDGSDEKEAARALTDAIDRGLRALTVNAPDWETLNVLDTVRRLYQPAGITLEQRTELARRFSDGYETVKHEPEVAALYVRARDYLDRLRAAGLTDRELRRAPGAWETLRRLGHQLALLLVWLPLALPGIVIHAPLGLAIGQAGLRLTPRKDVIATTKLVLGLLLVPTVFAVALGVLWWRHGVLWAALGLAFLTLSGVATVRVLERGARLGRLLVTGVRSLALGNEIASLRQERAALVDEIVRAVDRWRPTDLVPMFPSEKRS